MSLRCQLFENVGIGGPGAGLRPAAAFELELAEENVAELLGRADVERLAGAFVDFGFQPLHPLREFVGQPAQEIGIDDDAGLLHFGQHADQRTFQGFIDGGLSLFDEPWLQERVQAQGNVCVFRRVARRLLHRHAIETHTLSARAGDLVQRHRLVVEMHFRQFADRMAVQRAAEYIGNEHHVVIRRNADAALEKNQIIVFEILADLQHARIFEQRLQPFEDVGFAQLGNLVSAGEIETFAGAMPAGNVAGLARRDGESNAAEFRAHRIGRTRLRVDAHLTLFARARHPVMQPLKLDHRLVRRMIDGLEERGSVGNGAWLTARRAFFGRQHGFCWRQR